MADETEDFAALFEASIKAKRLKEGQTVEGTIVAIGPEVAFVDVGGKGEATIEIDELKDEDGDVEVSVGDRVRAMVVSTAGGLQLSRRLARGAATDRQLEDAFRAGLPVEGRVEKEVKGGFDVRIGRARAFCPFSQIDLHRSEPAVAHRKGLYVPHRRVHGGRPQPRRLAPRAARGRAAGGGRRSPPVDRARRGPDRPRRVGARVRRLRRSRRRHPGPAAHLGDGLVARHRPVRHREARRRDHRQGAARGRGRAGRFRWASSSSWPIRGRPSPAKYEVGQVLQRPRHARGRLRRVRRARARRRGAGARVHVRAHRPSGRWSRQAAAGTTAAFEILSIDLEKKRIGVAIAARGIRREPAARHAADIAPGVRLTGKVERHEKFGVFVFLAPGRTGLIPMSETGIAEGGRRPARVSRRRGRGGRRPRSRRGRPPHPPQREGGPGRARGRRGARLRRTGRPGPGRSGRWPTS